MNSEHFEVLFIFGRLSNGHQMYPESHPESVTHPLFDKRDFVDVVS